MPEKRVNTRDPRAKAAGMTDRAALASCIDPRRGGWIRLLLLAVPATVVLRIAGAGPIWLFAIEVFCYRIKKYIGAYSAALGYVDGLVFTGGIGENSPSIRALACQGLGALGIEIDAARNAALVGKEGEISTDASRLRVMVIPTNEELLIARDTFRAVRGLPNPH